MQQKSYVTFVHIQGGWLMLKHTSERKGQTYFISYLK